MTTFEYGPAGGQPYNQAAPDPYEVLGVPRLASIVFIKKIFREIVKRCHPDRINITPETVDEDLLKIACAAYDRIQAQRKANCPQTACATIYSTGPNVEEPKHKITYPHPKLRTN